MNNFKKSLLALSFLSIAFITGCGGGSSSSNNDNSTNTHDDSSSKDIVNKSDDIDTLKPYLGLAGKLVTGKQKSSCLPTGDGGGEIISQIISGSTIQFEYQKFDNESCNGDSVDMELSYYSLTIGDTIDNGKALEANIKYDHGFDIVDKVPNHMLGYDTKNIYYTTIVASGDISKNEIKMGIAKPSSEKDGSSPEKRANDLSDYTSGKYYFSN